MRIGMIVMLALLPALALVDAEELDRDRQWPQWRGPLGTGEAPYGDPPTRWSETQNVRFKVELPGSGHSTPVAWGDRLYLTAAAPTGDKLPARPETDPGAHDNVPPTRRFDFLVLAIDRHTGEVEWRKTVRSEQPHEGIHVTGSWASSSAVTDGRRIFAFFGSRGLYALDRNGTVRWQKDLGEMQIRHGHGEGASPALDGDTLVVNWDHQGDSFIVALDARTGAERWRRARDEITSWSTPLVVPHDGRKQVVVAATNKVRSYDLATGELLWQGGGLSRNVVASPVAGDGMVFVANSYDWQALLAIRLDRARGEIADTPAVVWTRDRDTPYVPSPLLYRGRLYFLKHSHAFLTSVDAATGETVFGPQRLPLYNVFASPVAAAGRVYVASREGAVAVLKHGSSLEVLARNTLDDAFSASPAIVGKTLYLRGERFLYALAEDGETGKMAGENPP